MSLYARTFLECWFSKGMVPPCRSFWNLWEHIWLLLWFRDTTGVYGAGLGMLGCRKELSCILHHFRLSHRILISNLSLEPNSIFHINIMYSLAQCDIVKFPGMQLKCKSRGNYTYLCFGTFTRVVHHLRKSQSWRHPSSWYLSCHTAHLHWACICSFALMRILSLGASIWLLYFIIYSGVVSLNICIFKHMLFYYELLSI